MRSLTLFLLSVLTSFVSGHARIRVPKPLDAPPEDPTGNAYNAPLSHDGSDFPCKKLHLKPGVDKTPTQSWQAGSMGMFEILGHVTSGEGALAAHSGGSCQASLSFDNGDTWKTLHSYEGGCPRGVPLDSNMAGPDQKFTFQVPAETKAGPCLFAWTWIAVTGNRDEYYMNCASVSITGSGTSTLDDYPDMFVGDMNLPGQIATGECRSTAGNSLQYPNPGPSSQVTETSDPQIPFKKPSEGSCYAPRKGGAPSGSFTVPAPAYPTTMVTVSRSSVTQVADDTTYPAADPTYPAADTTSYRTYRSRKSYPPADTTSYPVYHSSMADPAGEAPSYPADEPTSYPVYEPTNTYSPDEPTGYPTHRFGKARPADNATSYPASEHTSYPAVPEPTKADNNSAGGPVSYPAYQPSSTSSHSAGNSTSYPMATHKPTYAVDDSASYPVESPSEMYLADEPTTFSFVHATRTSSAGGGAATNKMYPGADSATYLVGGGGGAVSKMYPDVDPTTDSAIPTATYSAPEVSFTDAPASEEFMSTYCPETTGY